MSIDPPKTNPDSDDRMARRASVPGETESAAPPTQTQEHTPSPGAAGIPKRIGQYRIKRAIASGGMGTVYEALQEKPRRTVALKLMRAGIASRSALRRFEYESQLLARLRHPGIAQVYDAGTHRDGEVTVPYFAMEYIVGAKAVTEYVKDKKLGTRERMKLFAEVCEAVHHGHQKGIIHRDLKPSNILVDSSGQVKIIDFGVARCTDSDMAVTTLQTDVGQLIGTLQYMSPEQCAADPHDIDTRSDVYALGVVFYEMLCERMPYDLKGAAIHEATRVIREQEPAKLSTFNKTLRGDVETIVLKALEKDRDRRYRSCIELSDDLGRYLRNEPISARPASAMYQFKKLISRHKAPFAFVVMLFLLISGFGVWMSGMYTRAEGLRQDAVAAEQAQAVARQDAEEARAAEEGQRKLAQQREADAVAARAETQARADELKTVTEFQQSMLSDIDAAKMGRGIIEELREGIRKGLGKKEANTPQDVETNLASFDRLIGAVNATNLALNVVDEYVLTRAVETIHKTFDEQPLVRASLEQTVADTYRQIGLYERAMPLQEACLQTRRRELGDDHSDTLAAINKMALLLHKMGKLTEAEPYYREALQGNRRVLGDDHPDTLTTINNMGYSLSSRGKFIEAEPYYREALEGRRRVLGDDHPDTLNSIDNMGLLLQNMGKLTVAERFIYDALEGRRRVLGDDHPDTLTSINSMGNLLCSMGKFVEAEPYCREALEGRRRVLGDDHLETLTSIGNMGYLIESLGKLEEAERYIREALEGRRRVLGDDHAHTLISIRDVGRLLMAMGNFEEAEPYFRKALEGRRRVLGDDHPRTLISINDMGWVLSSMGKLEEAGPYYREALEGRRRVLGDDHPDTLSSINSMGFLLKGMGKLTEAEPYYRDAIEGRRRVLGDDHPNTLISIGNMGLLLQAMGKPDEAMPYYREALETRRRVLGDDHPGTLISINNMGFLLKSMGKLDDAMPYHREALEGQRRVLGDDHSGTLISINNMGGLLQAMGKYAEAEPYFREALEGQRRVLGNEHPSTLASINNMGYLLNKLGRYDDAAEILRAGEPAARRVWTGSMTRWLGNYLAKLGEAEGATQHFADGEATLREAHQLLAEGFGEAHVRTTKCITRLITLYESWHAAEPGKGYATKAAEWRAKLPKEKPKEDK